jgi:hypothetical protein
MRRERTAAATGAPGAASPGAEELRRAAELLETCRAKIRRAELEVTQIVQRLETPGEGS